ncbi:exodeoxyribonuclease III, partial [Escherichia coli]|nr:exodeoxyribonuclease III [Escherichia coli]
KPVKVEKGFPTDDEEAQRRMIMATFEREDGSLIKVMNGYFPQGESQDHETKFPAKQKFYEDLQHYLETNHTPDDQLVLIGDMNISPT